MALVTKNDVTQIFAIQAPEVDLPPTFANYPRGWDTARSNNGKPTIKQFNYIQQRTDQNMLWIHQNGAALPYDATMEYAEGAVVVKDGELQKKQGAGWVSATNKGYNLDYFVDGKSYPLHAEIMLANGDIVKSTVANNIVDPNVDMTGWVNSNSSSQIIDKSGKTQQERNDYLVLSNEKPTIQEIIDTLDTSSNIIKRGEILFNPLDEIELPSALNIEKMRIDLDGRNSILKRSLTDVSESLVRIYDSSFTKVRNFVLIGSATNPPLAAILFDNDNAALKGTNEKCTVQDVIIARKYLTDTDSGGSVNTGTPYGQVQNGILVRSGGYGNNDEHTFRNIIANDATVAGFNLDGDQHIWTIFENCLANGCATGYRLGSNVTMYNAQANRNSVADFDGIRNTEHQIFGMFIEHPKLAIKSTAASFFVRGGKILKNPTVKEPIIQYLSGGVLSLNGITIVATSNPQFNYINYNGGNIKQGGVLIDGCTIANGSKRDFYCIHTATTGHLQTTIDIKHGDFVFQTSAPYADELKATQTVTANSSALYSSAVASQLVYGKYVHSAIGAVLSTTAQVPVCLDTSVSRVRVMNRSGTELTIPDTQIRSMDLAGHVLQKALSAETNMSFTTRGIFKVNIPLFGVQLGDYVIPTVTTTMGHAYVLYGYATAANQATVVVESISTSATTLTAQIVGAAKFNENKARFHGITKTASLVAISAKQSTSFTVNVAGVQIGSHCLVAPCSDLGDLISTAHCNSDGVITVVVYNPSAVSVDLAADVFFKVCALF
jgi:hypothetical protein